MSMVDPDIYQNDVKTVQKGKTLLYVKVLKALYGLLKSALMFYKNIFKDLEAYGLKTNPYDPCVTDTIINYNYMNVSFHFYDLKVSHKDLFQIAKCLCYLSSIYGKELKLKRGKVHDYLGMDIDFLKR